MSNAKTFWGLIGRAVGLALLIPTIAPAQQPPPSPAPSSSSSKPSEDPQNRSEVSASQSPVAGDSNPEPPHPPVAPTSPLFRLSGGGLLSNSQGPLRLGPIYVASAEIFGAFDHFNPSNGAIAGQSQSGAFLRTTIVLDEMYKNTRFTVQWEPHYTYLNGTSIGDAENISAGFQSTFHLSPRFDITVLDRFGDVASRLLYGDFFVTSGIVETPASQQNTFLDAPGHSITEEAQAIFNYRLSQLTAISFTPSFNYFQTNTTSALLNSSREYSGQFTLSRTMSPRTTIGLGYTFSAVQFDITPAPTYYNTLTANYARLLTPSLSFTASGGVATFAGPSIRRSWTGTGSAALTKTYQTGYLAISYNRGLNLSDYSTTQFTDRIDGQAGIKLNPRINFQVGGGFQREGRSGGFRGRYADTSLGFRLAPTLSLYGRYTFSYQTGDQAFLLSGTRNLYVIGLRWDAGGNTAHQR
jgi:hypothetical protein